MKKLVFFVLITFGCIANDDTLFDSSTLDDTQIIYWVDSQTRSAVLYANFEVFHKLKNLVSTTILTTNATTQTSENLCSYDKLVFVDSNKNISSIFHIKNNSMIFNNSDFTVPRMQLSKFVNHNQNRINKGDGLHSKAMKRNINNYSEKCYKKLNKDKKTVGF
ncbi:SMI1/KNR4 family protein [Candidatus Colwellia aromaticivorans]|uniref:SMI1/KNR4 family protein n=1 Tax=Candidatus Colwellia aromaticivorans TaxID=2267621 RepID=UPI000DF2A0D1|nr:SMI1/KNR4 family protein [Candidatus Colwellia aromaticivorans]